MSKEERKSCRNCAYLNVTSIILGPKRGRSLRDVGKTIGKPTILGSVSCKQNSSAFNEKEIESNSCEKFMRKKEGMTLEKQIEEQKQEQIIKEQNRLPNRLRRNWYYVSALVITLIGILLSYLLAKGLI